MPEIGRDQLKAMLSEAAPEQREPLLLRLKERGYTVSSPRPDELQVSTSGQPVYPQQDQISNPQAALEATKEAWNTDIPRGIGSTVGKFREEIPNAIAEKTGALAEKAGPLAPLVRGYGVAEGGLVSTAANLVPKTIGEAALQEGPGILGRAVGPLVGKIAGKVGGAAESTLARAIGVAEPFIENARGNPHLLKQLADDPQIVRDYISKTGEIMKRGLDRAASGISKIEDSMMALHQANPDKVPRVDLSNEWTAFKNEILNRGIRTTPAGEAIPPKDFKQITSKVPAIVGEDAKKLVGYVNEINGIKDNMSFFDLINLKRRIGEDINWRGSTAPTVGSQAERILKGLYKNLNEKLYQMAPELREANRAYSSARSNYEVLSKRIMGQDPSVAMDRARLSIMRGRSQSEILDRASKIDSATEKAFKGVIDRVSAQQFKPILRKGIAGGFIGMGIPASAMMAGPEAGAMALVAAALSSPRMAALGLRGGGLTSEAAAAIAKQVAQNPGATKALGRIGVQSVAR